MITQTETKSMSEKLKSTEIKETGMLKEPKTLRELGIKEHPDSKGVTVLDRKVLFHSVEPEPFRRENHEWYYLEDGTVVVVNPSEEFLKVFNAPIVHFLYPPGVARKAISAHRSKMDAELERLLKELKRTDCLAKLLIYDRQREEITNDIHLS